MDPKELRGLYEAYSEVYAPQEEIDEAEKPFPHEKVKAKQVALRSQGGNALERRMKMGAAVRRAKEAEKTGGSQQTAGAGWYHAKEEVEIFDIVLEFLQAEGFAETLEDAEWMMANVIDEEAIGIILGEGKVEWDKPKRPLESGLTPREKNRAKRKSIGDKESPRYKKLQAAQDTQKGTKVPASKRHKFDTYDGDTLGQERRLTGDHRHYMPDKKRMKHYTTSLKEPKESYDISIDEAQEARNNPEKYEREQSKKYAPVRGERTPMPPRGDKRREDFEKWYAANVR